MPCWQAAALAHTGANDRAWVIDCLQAEPIPIVSRDLLDHCPRKVCFSPASGKALVKRLASAQADALARHDGAALASQGGTGSGAVHPFKPVLSRTQK